MKTLHLGPEEILVGGQDRGRAAPIRQPTWPRPSIVPRRNIREAEPMVTALYLEPDIYDPNYTPAAATGTPSRSQPLTSRLNVPHCGSVSPGPVDG